MRLFEIKPSRRPQVAGKAKLEYVENGVVGRDGNTIHIPENRELELFPLQPKWNQFLIWEDSRNSLWFGGTDENPFLVSLNGAMWEVFVKQGRIGFYYHLIPRIIESLGFRLGAKPLRQGDIFALPIPYSWEDLLKAYEIVNWEKSKIESVKGLALFRTRHLFVGSGGIFPRLFGFDAVQVIEGKVEAPDHSPMILEGPHVVAQTQGLLRPQEAD